MVSLRIVLSVSPAAARANPRLLDFTGSEDSSAGQQTGRHRCQAQLRRSGTRRLLVTRYGANDPIWLATEWERIAHRCGISTFSLVAWVH